MRQGKLGELVDMARFVFILYVEEPSALIVKCYE